MKPVFAALGFFFSALVAVANPDTGPLAFSRSLGALPPLSLAAGIAKRELPAQPSSGTTLQSPPKLPAASPKRTLSLPLVEPDVTVDYKMVDVLPDPNVDFKLAVKQLPPSAPASAAK